MTSVRLCQGFVACEIRTVRVYAAYACRYAKGGNLPLAHVILRVRYVHEQQLGHVVAPTRFSEPRGTVRPIRGAGDSEAGALQVRRGTKTGTRLFGPAVMSSFSL
jgi:hypothetical protein